MWFIFAHRTHCNRNQLWRFSWLGKMQQCSVWLMKMLIAPHSKCNSTRLMYKFSKRNAHTRSPSLYATCLKWTQYSIADNLFGEINPKTKHFVVQCIAFHNSENELDYRIIIMFICYFMFVFYLLYCHKYASETHKTAGTRCDSQYKYSQMVILLNFIAWCTVCER